VDGRTHSLSPRLALSLALVADCAQEQSSREIGQLQGQLKAAMMQLQVAEQELARLQELLDERSAAEPAETVSRSIVDEAALREETLRRQLAEAQAALDEARRKALESEDALRDASSRLTSQQEKSVSLCTLVCDVVFVCFPPCQLSCPFSLTLTRVDGRGPRAPRPARRGAGRG
jgi:hypothetical protein